MRWAGIFRAQTGENSCRGEHCSPVPACLTRKLSRKMRCGGKLTGDQWSPLHTQQGKTRPSPPATKKRRGGFHIRPCLLAARQTSAGAYRMRPYGFRFRPKGENSTRGTALSWPPLRGGSARRRWGREPCGGQECFGPRLAKTLVGASIARLCPLALQDNCPGKCVAAVSWRATNGRPYTRNREERASSLPATKNVGADSISARARLRQDKPPRAHIECAPTDFACDIGLAGSGRYNKKESVTS